MKDPIIKIDLHGQRQEEAIRRIDRILSKADASTYQIHLIHGYRGGEVLKDMIGQRYQDHPKIKRIVRGDNPGITVFVLRELI